MSANVLGSKLNGETFDVSCFYDAANRPEMEARKDTSSYIMQQTMMRVKNPKVSLDFYTKILGMSLLMHRDFPQFNFTVFFLGYVDDPLKIPTDPEEQWLFCLRTPGCVELTWNYGSETEEAPRIYNTGNSDTVGVANGDKVKGGFGHIGITTPDVYAACDRFHKLGVEFAKSPNGGGMKGLAFIKDPDGYMIEILAFQKQEHKQVDCLGNEIKEGDTLV